MAIGRRLFTPVVVALVAALVVSLAPANPGTGSVAAQAVAVQRLAGSDRYATAVEISRAFYAPGVPALYIATGENYPDALAAGPAAAREGGPLLTVRAHEIPDVVANEIRRLAPGRIVIVGGTGVVSATVEAQLKSLTAGTVQRRAGANRYATTAAISAAAFPPGVPVAYIATGENYPDALSAGPAVGLQGGPILLAKARSIPGDTAAELRRLRPGRIVVVGGSAVVSNAVLDALRPYTTGGVARHAGLTRYGTSAAISNAVFKRGTATTVFVATAVNFPDALAGVPAAIRLGAPLLLVAGNALSPEVSAELVRLSVSRVVILGGAGVVADALVNPLRGASGDVPPLPSCTVNDVQTKHRGYGDWWRTLLDWTYMVPRSYAPGDLAPVTNAGVRTGSYGQQYVRGFLIAELAALNNASKAAGHGSLVVNSAYRSYDMQADWFKRYADAHGYDQALLYTNRAGHSAHQLGIAIDINVYASSGLNAWMRDNAWRYGWVQSYPAGKNAVHCYGTEDWHYRYLGREAAAVIRGLGITEREYLWRLNGR